MQHFLRKILGSSNDRFVKKLAPIVRQVNDLEPEMAALSDEELKQKTPFLKEQIAQGFKLDHLLPQAFAVVREASKRVLNMRHFDVQLIGGIVLHRGIIAEMKTGEGKTLVATLPVYLNALTGKGVHVVTVNGYLAQRDAAWMGQIYEFLGLSVGCIVHGMNDEERKQAYQADVTYGTNNELGFDYLRDNMKFRFGETVQRPFNFAIVDEVDSILIDEARTPLIISGPAEESSDLYKKADLLIKDLEAADYEKDEKNKSVTLTDRGTERIEQLVKKADLLKGEHLYDVQNTMLVHHINQALKAHKSFTRDVDYLVSPDNKVVIIDEFTGRMVEGRRYSDGLHQAIEAKEHVEIEIENQTLASITFQNYFRLYPKLAGMTGTAETEASEFQEIYQLGVVSIPTHLPIARQDEDDEVYRTFKEKMEAVIALLKTCHERQQPVLVGTTSIEKSELFSRALTMARLPHQVLNARHHDKEAGIIAEAGVPGAITIATNMAGRGTDIKLGGNLEMRLEKALKDVEDPDQRQAIKKRLTEEKETQEKKAIAAGGLFVIGTERHESRRIDNQLRGRSGRQGDPGNSKFFLSLEDDLMRIFGSDRLDVWLQKLGLGEGEAIVHPWINKALEKAQRKVEARNFDIRKQLLKYDDVMNDQRKIIYEQRRFIMGQDDLSEECRDMRLEVAEKIVGQMAPPNLRPDEWSIESMKEEILRVFALKLPLEVWADEDDITSDKLLDRITEKVEETYLAKEKELGAEPLRIGEKSMLLRFLDHAWKDHLYALDHLRQGVHLRSYAQKDPLSEYKHEAFMLFERMLYNIAENLTLFLLHLDTSPDQLEGALEDLEEADDLLGELNYDTGNLLDSVEQKDQQQPEKKISRNAMCPCGSGKRFKNCHGKI